MYVPPTLLITMYHSRTDYKTATRWRGLRCTARVSGVGTLGTGCLYRANTGKNTYTTLYVFYVHKGHTLLCIEYI